MLLIPPQILLGAYSEGVFPMAEDGELQWYSPLMRGLIPLDERFHIPRGLKKALRRRPFIIRRDTAFREVMEGCADRSETWIDECILESYVELHKLGYAHSIECWDEDGLQGGLYGVRYKGVFFGESMFSRKTDASKIALVHLVDWLRESGAELLDTQWMTEHLSQFGGYEVSREEYLQLLSTVISKNDFNTKQA
ncbi:leucyl/phenylalanyl-tRNA--protein transferase [Rubritalea sp.]|uniref:leucyl/phenylalanyl-tRNA--protein transferase n=1 Tax=Rubritalea sp. TaxID=2109375 RepID=UPI003EF7DFAD